MARTYTLRGLFVVVTICCLLAWIGALFPRATQIVLACAAWLLPSLAVSAIAARFSSQRLATLGIGMGAAVLGLVFLSPLIVVAAGPLIWWTAWWEFYLTSYPCFSLPPAVCALVFAGLSCFDYPR
jgi:hypothetical protein